MTPDNLEEFKYMFPGSEGMKLAWSRDQLQVGTTIALRTFHGEGESAGVTPITGQITSIEENGVCLNHTFYPWNDVHVPPLVEHGCGYAVQIVEGGVKPSLRDELAGLGAYIKAGFSF